MFDFSKQYNLFVSDHAIPREHIVSLIRGNVCAIPRYRDTLFSIVTYYVNV